MGSCAGVKAGQRRWALALPTGLMVLAATPGSEAAQPGYQVTLGVIQSDNVQQLPSGTSDTIAMQELGFTWHDKRRWVDADLDADLANLTYLHHTFGDERIGNFIGQMRVALDPDVVFWHFDDNFGQGRVNALEAFSPENRENINVFSTGPQALLPLGSATLLDVNARYGKVTYGTSPFDNNRYSGGLGLIHEFSAVSSVSFNLRDERVSFANDDLSPNYDSQQAFVRFDATGHRTVLGVDLGYGRLRSNSGNNGNVLARLEVSRKMTAFSTVAVAFGHQYSDAASAFVLAQTISGAINLNTQSSVQSGTPFTDTYATLGWNFLRGRTGIDVNAAYYKESYPQQHSLDDNRTQIDAQLSRLLTPTLKLALTEVYLNEKYVSVSGTSKQTSTQALLNWRAARHLTFSLTYALSNRQSDIPGTNFTEHRIFLSVGYGREAQVPPGPATPPLPGRTGNMGGSVNYR